MKLNILSSQLDSLLLDVVSTEADPCFSWFVETIVNCLPVQIAMAADAIKVSKTNLLEKSLRMGAEVSPKDSTERQLPPGRFLFKPRLQADEGTVHEARRCLKAVKYICENRRQQKRQDFQDLAEHRCAVCRRRREDSLQPK